MQSKILIISLMLLILVLIGVTIIEPLTNYCGWMLPFAPLIVITGFFTFIVSVVLFLYGIIINIKNKTK